LISVSAQVANREDEELEERRDEHCEGEPAKLQHAEVPLLLLVKLVTGVLVDVIRRLHVELRVQSGAHPHVKAGESLIFTRS